MHAFEQGVEEVGTWKARGLPRLIVLSKMVPSLKYAM